MKAEETYEDDKKIYLPDEGRYEGDPSSTYQSAGIGIGYSFFGRKFLIEGG